MATSLPSFSKAEKILDLAFTGLEHKLPKDSKLALGGSILTVPEAVVAVGHVRAVFVDAREKHKAFQAAVEARRSGAPKVAKFLAELKAAVIGVIGADSPELANLGFPPRKKPSPLSSEAQLAKVAKLRETRAKRHTLGPREREAVKAEGEPVVSATFPDASSTGTAPVSPSPSSAPAPSPAPVAPRV